VNLLNYVAKTEVESPSLIEALGIEWQLLLVQIVAFILLVWLLGKFVYPWLLKAIDQRQKDIEDAREANAKAQKLANESKKDMEELLEKARKEASAIVSTAKQEASDIVLESEKKAQRVADRIAKDAQEGIARDIEKAKKVLREETIELVALATEKVVGSVHTEKPDAALIEQALEEAK